MAKNQFVSEYGELSNEILLNVAELLTLRLPEGSGKYILHQIWTADDSQKEIYE